MSTFAPPCRKFDCGTESTAEASEPASSPVIEETFRWYYINDWENGVGKRFEVKQKRGAVQELGRLVKAELYGNLHDPDMLLTFDESGVVRKQSVEKLVIVGSGETFRQKLASSVEASSSFDDVLPAV